MLTSVFINHHILVFRADSATARDNIERSNRHRLSANEKEEQHTNTHDATFRQFLTQPDIARDFMEIHLPAELRAICDLRTLKLESGSFVEDDLRQYLGFDALLNVFTRSSCFVR